MILTLAYRNLFHDGIRLAVTLVGIVFSIVLVAVQLGLFLGFDRMIGSVLAHTRADLWIVPKGTTNFDGGSMMSGRERYLALSTPGVATVTPLVVGFAEWRKPRGGTTSVILLGADRESGILAPWNVVAGNARALAVPDGVAVDRSYLDDLGIAGLGGTAEIEGLKARVVALTDGIRSFTTAPYVFTTLARARAYLETPAERVSYLVVHLSPGADAASVRGRLAAKLRNVDILDGTAFRARNRSYWLFGTGAGAALLAGAVLGILVGIVIVAQILYASTKDHLGEFATLRALGSTGAYIHRIILCQAGISVLMGYGVAILASLAIVAATAGTAMPVVMTPGLAAALFIVTLVMCVLSAVSAIVKVTRLDPAEVFSQ